MDTTETLEGGTSATSLRSHPTPTDFRTEFQINPFKLRECPKCAFKWLDKYRKDECPKCLVVISRYGIEKDKRQPGEVSTNKFSPGEAFTSEYGRCPRGGMHSWKFGICLKCSMGEGYAGNENTPSRSPAAKAVRKTCQWCSFRWLDQHGKGECPKCLRITWKTKADPDAGDMRPGSRHQPAQVASSSPQRKKCQQCSHAWLDVHGRNTCPLCEAPLEKPGKRRARTSYVLPQQGWRR